MTEMQYLDLHGERVAYLDEGAIGDGEREVILLLHGMAGSSQTWRPLMRSLARNFRVIAPTYSVTAAPPNREATIHWVPSRCWCAIY